MADKDILKRLIVVGAVILFCIVLFVNGVMFLVRPREWARSKWSLYSSYFIEDLDRPFIRVQMRVAGLGIALAAAYMSVEALNQFLGALVHIIGGDGDC